MQCGLLKGDFDQCCVLLLPLLSDFIHPENYILPEHRGKSLCHFRCRKNSVKYRKISFPMGRYGRSALPALKTCPGYLRLVVTRYFHCSLEIVHQQYHKLVCKDHFLTSVKGVCQCHKMWNGISICQIHLRNIQKVLQTSNTGRERQSYKKGNLELTKSLLAPVNSSLLLLLISVCITAKPSSIAANRVQRWCCDVLAI